LATVLAGGLLLCFAASAAASPIAPAVTKVQPSTGSAAGGTTVTITGSDFVAVTEVKFGSRAAASFEVRSSTEITAVTPPWTSGNAIAEVTVATLAETSANSGGDSFIYEPAVTKIEPTGGPGAGGTSVTITGEAFEGLFENGAGEMPPFVSSVHFGANKAASFEVQSSTQIVAVSPPGFGTQDVTVSTLGGTSASLPADQFAYATPQPPNTGSGSQGSGAAGSPTGSTGIPPKGVPSVHHKHRRHHCRRRHGHGCHRRRHHVHSRHHVQGPAARGHHGRH
jgi:hypothetical protein